MNPHLIPLLKLSRAERIEILKELWQSVAEETPQVKAADWTRASEKPQKASARAWAQAEPRLRRGCD